MTFSPQWENAYSSNRHMSIWPWSKLVSLAMSYSSISKKDPNFKVLELGCGAGANIPFFLALEADYYAIEGSESIVKYLHDKYPMFKKNILAGDFTENIPFKEQFDLIVDRGAITHNSTESIKNVLKMIKGLLKNGGKFLATDWFSTEHDQYHQGENSTDDYTMTNFKSGPFEGIGKVHFFNKNHIHELLNEFDILYLDHITQKQLVPTESFSATWSLVVS